MSSVKLQMGKKGNVIGGILGVFFIIILGMVVTSGVINNTVHISTNQYNNTGEAITVSSWEAPLTGMGDNEVSYILPAGMAVFNNSDCVNSILTANTHWVVVGNGTSNPRVNLTETGLTYNTSVCAVYSYRSDTYITDTNTRRLIGQLPVVFAILLLTAIAAYIVI